MTKLTIVTSIVFCLSGACVGAAVVEARVLPSGRSSTQPANAVVFPFSAKSGVSTVLNVANVGGGAPTSEALISAIATHWVFYSESSDRLAEAWVCLFRGAAVTMLPSRVVSIGPDGAEAGQAQDLSGSAGLAIVTAYEVDPNCRTTGVLRDQALVGSYTIQFSDDSFGTSGSANGFALDDLGTRTVLLDDSVANQFVGSDPNSLVFQSLTPDIFGGRIVLLGLQRGEIELEARREPVRFGVGFFDNLGKQTLLPPLSFQAALFASLFYDGLSPGLFPPTVSSLTSGILVLEKVDPTDDYLVLGFLINPGPISYFSTGAVPAAVCPGSGCVGLGPPLGRLEVPANGGNATGRGSISGWVCEALSGSVEVKIDGKSRPSVTYGGSRPDTFGRCFDEDNGFKVNVDWGKFDEGQHVVEAFVDGYLMGKSTFRVVKSRTPVQDAAGVARRILKSRDRIYEGALGGP